jgi:hypothetical protein
MEDDFVFLCFLRSSVVENDDPASATGRGAKACTKAARQVARKTISVNSVSPWWCFWSPGHHESDGRRVMSGLWLHFSALTQFIS